MPMAAAAATPVGTGGAAAATSRFAAACGALSQYVRAAEAAAERMQHTHARRPPSAVPVRPLPLPLMPGADVEDASPDDGRDLAQAAQMTIMYGGRVLVLDDVPADKAGGLLRIAAAAAAAGTAAATGGAERGGQQVSSVVSAAAADLLPVARKASLQRFMEKRKVRVAARTEPYRRPDASDDACPDHLKLAL